MTTGHVARLLDESRWLTALARRMVSDPSLADDLAQETLLSALHAKELPAADSTRGWLATIMRRKLLGVKRTDARRGEREEVAAKHEALPSASDLGTVLESERLLRDALEALTEPYRRVVLLKYREGLSAAEIARRDGEPAGTVRSRLRKGLAMLRDELEERDHSWAMALIPLAKLPLGPAQLAAASGAAAAATKLTSTGSAYWVGAAAAILVAVPVAWNAMGPDADAPKSVVLDSDLDVVRAAEPRQVAISTAPAVGERTALTVDVPTATPTVAPNIDPPAIQAAIQPGVVELTVVDEDGQPISGAFAQRWDDDRRDRFSEESGADGRLSIAPLKQAQSVQVETVLVCAPGMGAAREELTFRAGSTAAHTDIVLHAAVPVRGTVHDPEGAGKTFLVAFVAPLSTSLMDELEGGASLRSVESDLKALDFLGSFEATDPGSGAFALGDIGARSRGQVIAIQDDDGGRIGWSKVIELEAGSPIDLDPIVLLKPVITEEEVCVTPPEGSRSRGTGVNSPFLVEVIDTDGQPAESFELYLMESRLGSSRAKEPLGQVAGQDGSASFTPPSARWKLRIISDGGFAEVGPFDRNTFDGPAKIQLENSIAYRGTVARDGQPWANATLSLQVRSPEGLYFQEGEILTRARPRQDVATATTGPDGAFEFPPVMVGEYVIAADPKGNTSATFEVDYGSDLQLVAPGTGSVRGTVEARFGDVEGGIVTISHELGLRRSAMYGSDGAFQFDDLPAGLWRLGETYWPYASEWQGEADWMNAPEDRPGPSCVTTGTPTALQQRAGLDVQVAPGETTNVRLAIQTEQSVELTGTVKVNGRRPKERTVHFQRAPYMLTGSLTDQRWLRADGKGQFQTSLPGPGKWRVDLPLDIFGSNLWAEFNVAAGDSPAPLDVNFETGTLVLAGVSDDQPVSVLVLGNSDEQCTFGAWKMLMQGEGERRVLRGILAGEVQIVAATAGPTTPLFTGRLEPGATLELDVSR